MTENIIRIVFETWERKEDFLLEVRGTAHYSNTNLPRSYFIDKNTFNANSLVAVSNAIREVISLLIKDISHNDAEYFWVGGSWVVKESEGTYLLVNPKVMFKQEGL